MMDFTPLIKGETVEKVYQMYQEGLFLVNRNYQRKLVWTIEEKRSFVETIKLRLPVPLFLLAKKTYMGKETLEILDGLQRLNAITSFIEGDFQLDGGYFNLEANAFLKLQKDNGVLRQKTPILSSELSASIAGYQLPLSTTSFNDDSDVEEAFKRINSSGKHLSKQELRQAGADNLFSKLVRNIAEEIRGDCSYSNLVPMDKIKNISLSNHYLGYGIDMGKIFWIKNNIITSENIRESRDEELIAHILVAIISQRKFSYTSKTLDKVYGFAAYDDNELNLDDCIVKYGGYDSFKLKFDVVFQEIKNVLSSTTKSFRNILFTGKSSYYVNRVFYIVFLAFFDLLITEEMKVINYNEIVKHLNNEGTKIFKDEDISKNTNREQLIKKIKGLVQCDFEKRGASDPLLSNWIVKVEALLAAVTVEDIGYDFKIGFHTMHDSKFAKADYDTVLSTLLSMSNRGKDSVGYVIVGIADKEADSKRFEEFYGAKCLSIGKFKVAGVDSEAIKSVGSLDKYRTQFEQYIQNANIVPVSYRDHILKNIQFVPYYDKNIIVLQSKGENEPVMYEGQYYHRVGSSTTVVPPESMKSLFAAFR